MTCNLAVSITKAAVTEKHLQALLTEDVLSQIIPAYLQQLYPDYRVTPYTKTRGSASPFFVLSDPNPRGTSFTVDVSNPGRVSVRADAWGYATRGDQEKAKQITDQIAELLKRAADSLFARQVQSALAGLGGYQTVDTLSVDDAGVTQQATVLSIRL